MISNTVAAKQKKRPGKAAPAAIFNEIVNYRRGECVETGGGDGAYGVDVGGALMVGADC
jgi:hypothetical protein